MTFAMLEQQRQLKGLGVLLVAVLVFYVLYQIYGYLLGGGGGVDALGMDDAMPDMSSSSEGLVEEAAGETAMS